jgi:cytochrome P450
VLVVDLVDEHPDLAGLVDLEALSFGSGTATIMDARVGGWPGAREDTQLGVGDIPQPGVGWRRDGARSTGGVTLRHPTKDEEAQVMTTGPSAATEVDAADRSIEDLPTFHELDAPDFGPELDWVATDLFLREHQDLYQHPAYGVIVYRNADIHALGTDEAVSHPPLLLTAEDGAWDKFVKASTFFMRPPEHRPAKSILNRQLSHKSMHRFVATAEELAREAVRSVEGQDSFDLLADVVRPMMCRFWESVLGMTRAETDQVAELMPAFARSFRVAPTEHDIEDSTVAANEFIDVMTGALEREMAKDEHPILIDLLVNYGQMDGVGRPDNIATHFGAAFADGFNTAAGGAVAALYSLLSSPESHAAVQADPSLVDDAFNEGMRINPMVVATSRVALRDLTYHGLHIPAETPITMMWAYGNRDPEVFENPNEYRLHRENHAWQTTFGMGFYACPGRHTVKLIGKTLMAAFTEPGLDVTVLADPAINRGSLLREPEQLMMSVRRGRGA